MSGYQLAAVPWLWFGQITVNSEIRIEWILGALVATGLLLWRGGSDRRSIEMRISRVERKIDRLSADRGIPVDLQPAKSSA